MATTRGEKIDIMVERTDISAPKIATSIPRNFPSEKFDFISFGHLIRWGHELMRNILFPKALKL